MAERWWWSAAKKAAYRSEMREMYEETRKYFESLPALSRPTPREQVLTEATGLITGDRNQTYGSPTQNFTDTAMMWSIILRPKLADGMTIDPGEVASMMVALKLCRQVAKPHRDAWVDIAGYAGCGAEADLESGRINE